MNLQPFSAVSGQQPHARPPAAIAALIVQIFLPDPYHRTRMAQGMTWNWPLALCRQQCRPTRLRIPPSRQTLQSPGMQRHRTAGEWRKNLRHAQFNGPA